MEGTGLQVLVTTWVIKEEKGRKNKQGLTELDPTCNLAHVGDNHSVLSLLKPLSRES